MPDVIHFQALMAKTIVLGARMNADSVVPIISPTLTVIFLAGSHVLHFQRQRNWRTCFFIGNDAIMKTTTHCEVHPHVHEEYPCSVCVAESNIKQQEEFGRSWADSELRMLRADLAQATKERDSWKTKAEANEREARLYQWIVHEPESARHLLNLLREGKGTIDDFGQMIERIAASKQAARSAEKESK